MDISIDIGNTRSKWLLESEGKELLLRTSSEPVEKLPQAINAALVEHDIELPELQRIRVACVRNQLIKQHLGKELKSLTGVEPEFAQTSSASNGIVNSYNDPASMGVDRWCAIVAAAQESAAGGRLQAFCVIDAGSAVTLDFVNAHGKHCGGYITPGYTMQVNALLAGTQKVAASHHASNAAIEPGDNTTDAVHAGILASIVAHIERGVEQFAGQQQVNPLVFLTGGDAQLLQQFTSIKILHRPLLVLHGLKVLIP